MMLLVILPPLTSLLILPGMTPQERLTEREADKAEVTLYSEGLKGPVCTCRGR